MPTFQGKRTLDGRAGSKKKPPSAGAHVKHLSNQISARNSENPDGNYRRPVKKAPEEEKADRERKTPTPGDPWESVGCPDLRRLMSEKSRWVLRRNTAG